MLVEGIQAILLNVSKGRNPQGKIGILKYTPLIPSCSSALIPGPSALQWEWCASLPRKMVEQARIPLHLPKDMWKDVNGFVSCPFFFF